MQMFELFGFQQSWLLWGGLASIIPVIIHLISRSQGREVCLPSLQLLPRKSKTQTNQLKLTQWVLLIVRLMIITVVVLILAKLFWFDKRPLVEQPLVVITKQWLANSALQEQQELVERYPSASYLIIPDTEIQLKPLTLASLQSSSQQPPSLDSNNSFYLAEITQRFAEFKNLHVYSTNNANTIASSGFSTNSKIKWFLSGDKTINTKAIEMQLWVVYSANRVNDANNIIQVLSDLKALGANIKIHRLENSQSNLSTLKKSIEQEGLATNGANWLFWLSPEKIPQAFFGIPMLSTLADMRESSYQELSSLVSTKLGNFQVKRIGNSIEHPAAKVWLFAQNLALLSTRFSQNKTHLYFNSRFNEMFSNWHKQGFFVEQLGDILSRNIEHFPRQIDESQLQQHITSAQSILDESISTKQSSPSEMLFWILIFLILFERRLAASNQFFRRSA
ncbi:BatA domain-containing protein [Aliikangiella sp. IMCC44632]